MGSETFMMTVYPMALGVQKLYGLKAFANAKEIKVNDLGDFLVHRKDQPKIEPAQEINLLE